MKNYRLTIIGFFVSAIFWFITFIFELDLFEAVIETFERFEKFEIDELVIPSGIFGIFVFLNLVARQKAQVIEIEKIKIYKAMLSSSHHILNNFLNQMQLFKVTAETTEGFPNDVLELYDRNIDDAILQIEALGNINDVDEKSIAASVAPKTKDQDSAKQTFLKGENKLNEKSTLSD